ncbi:MAG TPA: outer membrane beta-barrel protein [Candidatus Acidoferrales bacterium]|nr:outer membrane beta-barrel protein [Candidatus Acidoferrales bacterium]
MASAASIALPAYAQPEEAGRQEVAIQAFGSFVTTTTQNGIDNTATNSGGVLASYRFFFSKHHGVEANYGYARNTQSFTSSAGALGVKTDSHEVSGAYVFRMPLGKLSPFALAGVGALVFDPHDFTGASTQTRAAFVYGGGADWNFSHHLFLRAEYRGFVYNSPTYDLPGLAGTDRISHRAEPSIGFGYRF